MSKKTRSFLLVDCSIGALLLGIISGFDRDYPILMWLMGALGGLGIAQLESK